MQPFCWGSIKYCPRGEKLLYAITLFSSTHERALKMFPYIPYIVDYKNAPKVLELIRDLRVPGEASLLDHCYLEFSLATTYLI